MPAEYFHVACARDALELAESLPFELDTASFALGCQGPDIFSHNRRTKPLALAYARLLHRREYGTFCGKLAPFVSGKDRIVLSWFLGFLTHAAVDRTVHPYVICRSSPLPCTHDPLIDRARLHAFFERILDDALEGERGYTAAEDPWRCRPVRVPAGLAEAIAGDIEQALVLTYQDKAGDRVAERVINAFSDADRVFALTGTDYPGKDTFWFDSRNVSPDLARLIGYGPDAVALLRPIGLRHEADWLNLNHEAWPHPVTGEPRTESVPELAVKAAERAAEAVLAGLAVLAGRAAGDHLASVVGNECLSACGSEGLPSPVLHSAPFELTQLLIQQTELRQAQFLNRKDFS